MDADIRRATTDDLPAVSALLGATWHATYDCVYGAERVAEISRRWHAVEALAQGIGRPDTCFLVATHNGRLTGTISLVETSGGALDLKRLYVHPQAQRRGVGGRLLETALATFPGASVVVLEVEPANTRAVHFYERKGFAVTGRTGDCNSSGDRIPALLMMRRLDLSRGHSQPLAASGNSSD